MTVKLFNLIARDLGPGFLENGIRLEWYALRTFLQENAESLGPIVRELVMDGRALGMDAVSVLPEESGEAVFFAGEG